MGIGSCPTEFQANDGPFFFSDKYIIFIYLKEWDVLDPGIRMNLLV